MAEGNNGFSKNFFFIAFFALIVLALLIIAPLFTALVLAAILAYIFYPVYVWMSKKINKRISAIIIIVILLSVLSVATYFTADALTKEGYTLFIMVKQKLSAGGLETIDCVKQPSPFCELTNRAIESLKNPQVQFYVEDTISKVSNYVISKTTDLISNLPTLVIDLFTMFFAMYYFLVDGTKFVEKAKKSIPLKKHHVDHIMFEFENFTYATLYGHLITSLVQGVVGGLVFFALGLSAPVLAGIGMAFFAFIPFLGTPVIWLPTAITLLFTGEVTKAVVLLLLGTFLISTVDNMIRPAIIGNRVKLHPALVLVGIIGGMFAFGLIGLLIGPLIFSLLLSFIDVYFKEGLGFNHE